MFPFGYTVNGKPLYVYYMEECDGEALAIAPIEPTPEIPPEVHNTRPINPLVCMAAVRAMSRGER